MLHALLFIHNPDIFSSGRSVSLLVYLELGLQSELTGEGSVMVPAGSGSALRMESSDPTSSLQTEMLHTVSIQFSQKSCLKVMVLLP